MVKALTILGMVVAAMAVLAFGIDMVASFPFGGASGMMNIGFIIAGSLLGYLSWNAFRDIR